LSGTGLTIHPGPGLSGRFVPPGDKSITHRAFLLALLADGASRIEGANPGEDCARTLECAARLGAGVEHADGAIVVHGTAGKLSEPDRVLDCGNSGTTLRLLAGVLSAHRFLAVLSGDDSLRGRPVARVIAPLRRMGAWLAARDGDRLPPLVVRGGSLVGAVFEDATSSAQVASCILLAGLQSDGTTSVRVAPGVRDHTSRMLAAFGVPLERAAAPDGSVHERVAGPSVPRACAVQVPGDFSAAAFALAAAAAVPGASVTAVNVSLNPTRLGLLTTLEEMGAAVERRETGRGGWEPAGDVTVTGPDRLSPVRIPAARVPLMIDEIPAWVVAASAAHGTSTLAGAAELRVKETDRIAALVANLRALGVEAEERPDGLALTGGPVRGGNVAARRDHRIAMAFAALGTRAAGPVTIDDASSIATSYPGFVAALAALGGRVEGVEAGA
jgi:3-phosphoshikimate 1-carboxyvinyltransferase